MATLRVIHFADLHLGVESGGRANPTTGLNQRIHDVCDRLDEVCACVESEDVHLVVFAGDAFKHQHPTPTLQRLFAQRIRRIARSGARVFLLVGNHDLPKMAALAHPFSIYDALEVEGVVIGDRAGVYRLPLTAGAPAPEIQVAALPHFSRQHVLAKLPDGVDDPDAWIGRRLEETVRVLGRDVDPALPVLFAGHCHVNQAQLSTAQALFGISEIEVSLSTLTSGQPFPYYALGHVHRRQVLSDDPFVAYSGSLERVDFGEGSVVKVDGDGRTERREAEAKGFYRFDLVSGDDGAWRLDAPPEFRAVNARPFVTIRVGSVSGSDPMAELLERVETARRTGCDLQDAFVKVTAEVDAADRARLTHRAAREAVPEAYDVRLSVEVRGETPVRDPRFAKRMGEREALERYLETREDWSDDRDDLLHLGAALIEEVAG